MILFEEFKLRMAELEEEIALACSKSARDPTTVELLPVTKTHPAEAIEFVARYGLKAVGENRLQEAIEKKAKVSAIVRWDLIGHLQSNKAKLAAQHFDRVQSVDSEKLLTLLDRAAGEQGKTLAILLQINAGNDPGKFGADPPNASALLESALGKAHLRLEGLMTIAPLSEDPEVALRTFMTLRQLRDELAAKFQIGLPTLSMGMSGDFAAAISAGSTQIRVGSALFGPRPPREELKESPS